MSHYRRHYSMSSSSMAATISLGSNGIRQGVMTVKHRQSDEFDSSNNEPITNTCADDLPGEYADDALDDTNPRSPRHLSPLPHHCASAHHTSARSNKLQQKKTELSENGTASFQAKTTSTLPMCPSHLLPSYRPSITPYQPIHPSNKHRS
jgi:hypothetical protein